MLTGRVVSLRALRREDITTLAAELENDPELHAQVSLGPWRPLSREQRLADFDRQLAGPPDPSTVEFAVRRRDDPADRAVGRAVLWGIDDLHRTGHAGVRLMAAARGHGLGRDVLRVLCRYAFDARGLHRVQLETLASNLAMQRAALAAGFVEEGRLRQHAFVLGQRQDEVLFGLLVSDRTDQPG